MDAVRGAAFLKIEGLKGKPLKTLNEYMDAQHPGNASRHK